MIEHTQAILLMDVYKELLTPRQQEILSLYFEEDLSLSEIQENLQISRSAAQNAIQKAVSAMEKYESILKVNRKNQMLEQLLEQDLQKHPELAEKVQEILDV